MHENFGELSDGIQVLHFLNATFTLIGIHYGIGQHISDLTPSNFSTAMKVSSHTCLGCATRFAAHTCFYRN
jgi:hypothetical protein